MFATPAKCNVDIKLSALMNSYSIRCLFLWAPRHDQVLKHLYEERITLWQADNFGQAIVFAEQEAKYYASEDMEYLGFAQSYELIDPIKANGIEIFSLLRESDLNPQEYIDAFFDTGNDRQASL